MRILIHTKGDMVVDVVLYMNRGLFLDDLVDVVDFDRGRGHPADSLKRLQ